jgi:iron complex transport system substrate-binding protein
MPFSRAAPKVGALGDVVPGYLGHSLRARREAVIRFVAPFDKDWAIACKARRTTNRFTSRCIHQSLVVRPLAHMAKKTVAVIAAIIMFASVPASLFADNGTASRPQRIVSTGLCTDQLLLMIADRSQIASLSSFVTDPIMSYMVDTVGDLPLNNASVEEVIPYHPDLVVGTNFAAWDTTRFLRQLGYDVKIFSPPTTIEETYILLGDFGKWTGNEARATKMIGQMKQEISAIRSRYAHRPEKSVIVYAPNGYTIGANTLENDILEYAGYRNLAAELGIEGFQQISLERLIAAKPDVLHIDNHVLNSDSLASAYVRHPVLDKVVAQKDHISIPAPLRICAGPMLTEAIEYMAAKR